MSLEDAHLYATDAALFADRYVTFTGDASNYAREQNTTRYPLILFPQSWGTGAHISENPRGSPTGIDKKYATHFSIYVRAHERPG